MKKERKNMVTSIGVTAGKIWQQLDAKGESTVAKLKKAVDADTFSVNAAIGWLAREDKVELTKSGNTIKVRLKEN